MNQQQVEIGKYISQPQGFMAFVPNNFPPFRKLDIDKELSKKHTKAINLLGELNGITRLLPDKDCFLRMFIIKDASSSSQIEGTNATMNDAIEAENIDRKPNLPSDVDDILHYIKALNYGLKRLEDYPLSLSFIKELHAELMTDARSTQFAYPGEFRISQNWIGGTKPSNARFVPPPVGPMKKSLSDLEKFIHADDEYLPLIKAGLIHSQFETIHPFTDGNGRTGRMLITMFLWFSGMLRMPVLYLSSYFKKYQDVYYEKINGYHNGRLYEWIDFFLDAVIDVANSAIDVCDGIVALRERDMTKIQKLNQSASESAVNVLLGLYKMPTVGVADVMRMTGFTKAGTYKVIDRMVRLKILYPVKQGDEIYGQKWTYKDYLMLFDNEESL